jgi:alkanesulfonate monooxygenase SsuD/methylene tetrahydromethanopterin reductase-like flavin-dependent oxidoreductase (luciferase family)
MKFSVWPNSSNSTDDVLAEATWADEQGFHGIWIADHYMPNTGSEEIQPGDMHECWSILPAIAAVTDSARIGPLVSPTSVHHPALLANRAATIDHISGGRMVLGLGAGWQINEHKAYGIELQAPKQRVDRFEEAIQITRSLLNEDRTSFDGEYYTFAEAPADPHPVQSPLPILVGTGSPRMLRITARHADEWNTWGTVEGATERAAAFERACEAVGVDRGSKWASVQALVMLSDDAASVEKALASPWGERMIAGNADQLAEQLSAYAALGFDEFIVPDFNLGSSLEKRVDAYGRLKAEVLDRL